MRKAYLVFEDGTVFEGEGFGAEVESVGEAVFNTNVVGYIETLTDPAYAGQIVVQTFPMIGNYGIIEEDFVGQCCVKGYVAREWCDEPSNFRSEYTIDQFLKERGVPGICGVDTRAITRKLRDGGAMNAMICSAVPEDLAVVKEYRASGLVSEMTCKAAHEVAALGECKKHAVVIDYGMMNSVAAELAKRGCGVTVVPAWTSAEEILALKPDGVLLSGGPGDPMDVDITAVKALMGKVPVFGIGLGHQLAALATGAATVKMVYGHRGSNQPVHEKATGRTYITAQNHGYVVDAESVKMGFVSFANANDGSCEGIEYPTLNAFTVQFNPDSTGPRNTAFLYDRFITMMGGEN